MASIQMSRNHRNLSPNTNGGNNEDNNYEEIDNDDDEDNTSLRKNDKLVASMKRLKKMGWYWGSISPGYASKLLENEQDGSFLVRDSSSECYIFSMTLKLDGQIHHTRIEHCKGKANSSRVFPPTFQD